MLRSALLRTITTSATLTGAAPACRTSACAPELVVLVLVFITEAGIILRAALVTLRRIVASAEVRHTRTFSVVFGHVDIVLFAKTNEFLPRYLQNVIAETLQLAEACQRITEV
jgi:hypothetical protein